MERPAPPAALHAQAEAAWLLSDGHAGNVRQAQALAVALGIDAPREWALQARAPWRWLAPRRLPGAASAFGTAFARALSEPPALAIGCGRQGALATRLARARGAKTVQILDPRIAPTHWDLVVAPQHDRVGGRNVITLLGSLHPVDDLWLARARADFAVIAQLPQPRTALLLGGPGRHVRFDQAALDALATQVDAALARDGGSLLLTASRRTPAPMRAALRRHYAGAPGVLWLGPEDGANPYPGLLAWADRIVCSPDSVNMVSEACATTVPVFVAAPASAGGRVRGFLDALLACGRIRALDAALAPFAVEPLRETARVAAEVQSRLAS
ncbi:mitochondrial fission ELM1 family protein [Luteimonas sp. 50]|uniref:Mitochondrial fission ELM1 family protein n=1 Tax=Cognatiluteimonas sedimenti TaxID=2927791 RepID=A0ABT0A3Q7_9GAMM|nr:mitochondrial fission ELM1 family protein [Lysobacter sedimenti]MCJ0825607.1 mitochondrial fission ELM1 family protein [Lysobacter sedimenti]